MKHKTKEKEKGDKKAEKQSSENKGEGQEGEGSQDKASKKEKKKKKKKEKEESKNGDGIKRPLSAYMLYNNYRRPVLRKEFPSNSWSWVCRPAVDGRVQADWRRVEQAYQWLKKGKYPLVFEWNLGIEFAFLHFNFRN